MSRIRAAWIIPFLLFLQFQVRGAAAGNKEAIQEDLSEKTRKAEREQRQLKQLTSKERSLYANLAEIEDRIKALLERKQDQQHKLDRARKNHKELEESSEELAGTIRNQRRTLKQMLAQLWTLNLHNRNRQFHDFRSWAENDLKFTWLSAIYRSAGEKLDQLTTREQELSATLEEQNRIKAKINNQLALIQATQDKLLKNRLNFLHRLQKIRARKMAKEEQLAQIKETIQKLEYKLKAFENKEITALKGGLPWPVQGELAKTYAPNADPPLEGLAFSSQKGAEVRSIFWGKVVYSDELRGFGKVVVIFHGNQYYSLYAFLAEVDVDVGRNVKDGEIIGHTGYYPLVKGPGLYFELRLGQSPVNPGPWLVKTG